MKKRYQCEPCKKTSELYENAPGCARHCECGRRMTCTGVVAVAARPKRVRVRFCDGTIKQKTT